MAAAMMVVFFTTFKHGYLTNKWRGKRRSFIPVHRAHHASSVGFPFKLNWPTEQWFESLCGTVICRNLVTRFDNLTQSACLSSMEGGPFFFFFFFIRPDVTVMVDWA